MSRVRKEETTAWGRIHGQQGLGDRRARGGKCQCSSGETGTHGSRQSWWCSPRRRQPHAGPRDTGSASADWGPEVSSVCQHPVRGQPPWAAIACPAQWGRAHRPHKSRGGKKSTNRCRRGWNRDPEVRQTWRGAAGPSGLCVSMRMSASWAVALTRQRPSFTGLSWAVPRGVQKGSAGPRTAEGWAACDGVRAGHTGMRAVLVRSPSLGEAWGPREA